MTVGQVVQTTIDMLGQINVPASMIEQIGIPIARSISNLRLCVDAWNQQQPQEPEIVEVEDGKADIE